MATFRCLVSGQTVTFIHQHDIDSMKGKLGKTVDALRDKLLKNSRKLKVSVISTSHDACGQILKIVLNESKLLYFLC